MPTYFFNVISEGRRAFDHEGQECASLEAAMDVAELSLCEIAGEALKFGSKVLIEAIVNSDDAGNELARKTAEATFLPRFAAFTKFRQQ
ncbi:DUF6894 family protein [Rhizobium sp. YIM 134829]|uniref:DUF6894 family protein n=1 Tax=Rhizobium sp. YIM 134829 TaxID=3390453 RepID=UPI00397B27D3